MPITPSAKCFKIPIETMGSNANSEILVSLPPLSRTGLVWLTMDGFSERYEQSEQLYRRLSKTVVQDYHLPSVHLAWEVSPTRKVLIQELGHLQSVLETQFQLQQMIFCANGSLANRIAQILPFLRPNVLGMVFLFSMPIQAIDQEMNLPLLILQPERGESLLCYGAHSHVERQIVTYASGGLTTLKETTWMKRVLATWILRQMGRTPLEFLLSD